jgi:hypothetical protein
MILHPCLLRLAYYITKSAITKYHQHMKEQEDPNSESRHAFKLILFISNHSASILIYLSSAVITSEETLDTRILQLPRTWLLD